MTRFPGETTTVSAQTLCTWLLAALRRRTRRTRTVCSKDPTNVPQPSTKRKNSLPAVPGLMSVPQPQEQLSPTPEAGILLKTKRLIRKTEKVTLYKKYLKFECPAASCRIKLLSIGEKQRVLISKIIVQVKTVSAKLATDFPSLGSSIDLDRVQTIMESMGSKLSPGAQQLMDMVRCQQKNSSPLGDKLNWIFGKNSDFGGDHAIDGLCSAAIQTSLDQSASEPLPVKNHLTSETVYEDLFLSCDLNTQVPERGNSPDSERLTTQQNTVDLRNDFKVIGSLHMQEQVSETPNVANPQVLLPFLQNLCSQVNHLRLKDGNRHFGKNAVTKEEGIQCVGVEQQPICSYLEKMISKKMDLMEKKLMDYIDHQIQALQTHVDNKMVLLMDLVQNSKPNKISQARYDSNEGFSNGER
ncbi:PREDICTED: uncharacterized protein C10orf88 homolog [Pygoscelis adeliae]|nr:PREDICTED: uncharacterized protein C10orf88 homolog [Pygoscelis adeliae]